MNILTVSVSTLLIPIIVVITVAVFFIYKAVYDKHTNQILESGETKKRKWIAPWGLALIVLGAQLILVAGFMFPASLFMINKETSEITLSETDEVPADLVFSQAVRFVVEDKDFEKIGEATNDDITVTIYKKTNSNGSAHFVYVGSFEKKENSYVIMNGRFSVNDTMNYSISTYVGDNSDISTVFFKAEFISQDGTEPKVSFGVFYGSQYREIDDPDQSITIG